MVITRNFIVGSNSLSERLMAERRMMDKACQSHFRSRYDGMRMSKRRSIEVPGLEHTNPLPNASRVGPLLMTSGIFGKDPATGKVVPGIAEQCAMMFANIRRVLEAGGATPEDIVKINVWMKNRDDRDHLNREWLAMFPDPHSRPARHTFKDEDQPYGALISCEVIAVIG
jgi:2-iminobutanoate/2-iminopropanoate deaminase